MGIKPMLANAVDYDLVDKKCKGYWVEEKLDGWRCIVEKRGSNVRMYSRTGKDFTTKLPDLIEQFRSVPYDFVLDGELGYPLPIPPVVDSEEGPADPWLHVVFDYPLTASVLGSSPAVSLDKQQQAGGPPSFYAFDLLALWGLGWGGVLTDQPYRMRRAVLDNLYVTPRFGTLRHAWLSTVYMLSSTSPAHLWRQIYEDYILIGGEGIMLKNPNAAYVSGKRPANNWYKLKAMETVDAVITGFTEGKGKYEGQIGSICFRTVNGTEGSCSGMTDEQRDYLTRHQWNMKGQWIEVRVFGKVGREQDGYRHPQFVRFREAK